MKPLLKLRKARISGAKRRPTASSITQGLQALPPHQSGQPKMINETYLVKYLNKDGLEGYKLATAAEAQELTQPGIASHQGIKVLFIQPYC